MLYFRLLLRRMRKRMEAVKEEEIQEMLLAIIRWQKDHYPDEELIVFSLPKSNLEKREVQLKLMVDMLQKSHATNRS